MGVFNDVFVSVPDIYVCIACISAISIVYAGGLVIYRLFLSPISHIPGPKMAAATLWYEFYYNVVKEGTYFLKVQELHKQYGEQIASFKPHNKILIKHRSNRPHHPPRSPH